MKKQKIVSLMLVSALSLTACGSSAGIEIGNGKNGEEGSEIIYTIPESNMYEVPESGNTETETEVETETETETEMKTEIETESVEENSSVDTSDAGSDEVKTAELCVKENEGDLAVMFNYESEITDIVFIAPDGTRYAEGDDSVRTASGELWKTYRITDAPVGTWYVEYTLKSNTLIDCSIIDDGLTPEDIN